MANVTDPWRRTGRSTRGAIEYLKVAIENAGSYTHIVDHHGTHAEAVRVAKMVSDMLRILDIPHRRDQNMICVERMKR